MSVVFKVGQETEMAIFIAEIVKQGICFEAISFGNEYVINFTGGF